MPEPCDFPSCTEAVALRRPDGSRVCTRHEHVHVSSTGSWIPDHHTDPSQE